jgi:hypothetical protein
LRHADVPHKLPVTRTYGWASGLLSVSDVSTGASIPWLGREAPLPPPPRLLDRVRAALRARHFSRRTEEACVAWIRRYIFFHDKRHPADMGTPEVTRFLTSLAVDRHVAVSTPGFGGIYRPAYLGTEF